MRDPIHLKPQEERLLWELLEELQGSLDLNEVLRRAYAKLCQIVPADQGSLCVSLPGRPDEYDWAVAELPPQLFAGYAELAPHDFVRRAVLEHPNLVLRDSEMISRSELARSVIYHRCRDLGLQLEQVMAVQLAVEPGWHGGLTLYRSRQRPFTDRDRALLQRVSPLFAVAVKSCRRYAEAEARGAALEAMLHRDGAEVILISPPSTELWRSQGATALLERWFTRDDLPGGGLPTPLAEALRRGAPAALPWVRHGKSGALLRVDMLTLPMGGRTSWVLELREVSPVPRVWMQRLTPRQIEVVTCMLQGWDNKTIAGHLDCGLETVRRHVYNVFNALGVSSRAALLSLAARLR